MNQYLLKIYSDFLEEKTMWCNLVNSQFSNSQYSNYNNKQYEQIYIEQYYLLRYAPLYMEEYHELYLNFLQYYCKSNIKILSVGVGSGLDFWGFANAVTYLKKTINIDYMGIDLVDWKYRLREIRFLQKSLEELTYEDFNNFTYGKADVIAFPKSIIEIPKDTLIKFSNFIVERNIKDIWFLISYVKRGDKVSGIDKMKHIHDILIGNKYKLVHGDINEYHESSDKHSKISYPMNYKNTWMKCIIEHCSSGCDQQKISQCNISGQYPMLYKKNIAYGIYNFKR